MEFLGEVLVLLASAVIMVPLARRFGLGAVLGYLAAGVLVVPVVEQVCAGRAGACWGPVFGQKRRQTIERAKALMKFLRIERHLETSYVNLSGGEQRRCLLARALMRSPSAVLLDEPTTGIDQNGHSRFCNILNNLSKEGVTIILVSHDIPVVSRFSKRIAYINKELSWEECLIN